MGFQYSEYTYMLEAPEFHIPEDDPEYCSEDGVLFTKDKTKLVRFPTNRKVSHYRVPDSVTKLGHFAFGKCQIESLDLNKVKKVGQRVVWDCENLRAFDFGTEIEIIPSGFMFGIHNLRRMVIPPSVKEIRDGAMEMVTNLKEIVIPKTVEKLGRAPFGTSGSILMHFEYNGAVLFVREQPLKPGKDGALIDFEAYDERFQQLQFETRALTAFFRIAYPADLTESWRQFYTMYLRCHLRDLTDSFFAKNRVDWMRILIEREIIYKYNVDEMIEDSTRAGTTTITALLLDYKRKILPEAEDEFEL